MQTKLTIGMIRLLNGKTKNRNLTGMSPKEKIAAIHELKLIYGLNDKEIREIIQQWINIPLI